MKQRGFALLLFIVGITLSGCTTFRNISEADHPSISFALIGDMPYYPGDEVKFERMITQINAEEEISWVLHVGDIKTGNTPCTDEYLAGRLALFEQFAQPFIFIPGDNEWTDCHRAGAGEFEPLERLAKLRALFYPTPGESLGKNKRKLDTQAENPEYAEFPEHVRWVHQNVVFAGLHIVGSKNGLVSFEGRTEKDDAEVERRSSAALAWMQDAFTLAQELNSPGVFLMIHANPGFTMGPEHAAFHHFLEALEAAAVKFGKPVLLAHGDSHYFRIDKPLVGVASKRRISNFTRVETFGAGDVHWLRITVDPDDENVFIIKQEIVSGNLGR